LFFPAGSTGLSLVQIDDAKAVCARCEVMDTCLSWALDNGADDGVWGGLSEDERRALKRRNARSAPRTPKPATQKPPAAPAKVDPVTRPSCGRRRGYEAHTAKGERQCDTCKAWHADRGNRAECGTANGYRLHGAHKEAACDPCKAAKAAESAEYRRRHRTNAA
jgi:WhiB family redox-sensing transcriptional regulator